MLAGLVSSEGHEGWICSRFSSGLADGHHLLPFFLVDPLGMSIPPDVFLCVPKSHLRVAVTTVMLSYLCFP